ncbi:MAG: hypothetical protein AAF675_20270, partial [Pseudomonadota bacterium]
MKLQARAAERYCDHPDGDHLAFLLHGPDAALVAERRRRLTQRLTADDPMRLTSLEPGAVRRDPAVLFDALRSSGFFADAPVVLIEGVPEGLASAVEAALEGLSAQDGRLVLTAGTLTARSVLRRQFEGARVAVALGLYPQPPDAVELEAMLREAGLSCGMTGDALESLVVAGAEMDRGTLAQSIATIALFGLDASEPLEADVVKALLPVTAESETERLVAAVAAGQASEAAMRLRRCLAGGMAPVSIVIQISRHYRMLYGAALGSDPEQAVDRLR